MNEKIEDVLGLPQKISDFTDGKVRTAYPVTLKDFPAFVANLGYVNPKSLWNNMLFDEGVKAVETTLSMVFKEEPIDELMENINARNYPVIIGKIMAINGINIDKKADEDPNIKEV